MFTSDDATTRSPSARSFSARLRLLAPAAAALTTMLAACHTKPAEPKPPEEYHVPSATSAPAFSASPSSGWNGRTISIQSAMGAIGGGYLCLDIPNSTAFNGANVNYYPCHYQTNQRWVVTAWDGDAYSSWVIFKSALNTSLCLDVRGQTANGGEHMQLSTCNTRATSQTFAVAGAKVSGTFFLETPICTAISHNHMGIDLPLPVQSSGYVQQYKRNSGSNQLWYFYDVATSGWLNWLDPQQHIPC